MVVEIEEKVQEQVKELFNELEDDVVLRVFTKEDHCLLCNETLELVKIVASLSEKIKIEHCECDTETEEAKKFGIDKHPAIVVQGKNDCKLRFFGIPSGFEFRSLVDTIVDASTGKTGLEESLIEELQKIDTPVHIQVFVTPTCPYCPKMVQTAHKFSMINPEYIRSDMIEATEFQELSQKYGVFGVPKTIINEEIHIEGAIHEKMVLQKVLQAIE